MILDIIFSTLTRVILPAFICGYLLIVTVIRPKTNEDVYKYLIYKYLGKRDLCQSFNMYEQQKIRSYQLQNSMLIYDLFISDRIDEIDLKDCVVNNDLVK